MEFLMSIIVGIIFMAATYLMLSKSLLRVIVGTAVLSHGVHLLLLTMGGLKRSASVLKEGLTSYVDPLPQALILTAIVIAFGVTSLLLVMAFRAFQELRTDDMDQMRGNDQHE